MLKLKIELIKKLFVKDSYLILINSIQVINNVY